VKKRSQSGEDEFMAKDKIKKSPPTKTTKASPAAAKPKRAAPAKAAASARTPKPVKVSRPAKTAKLAKISKLAKSPAAAEVVAATLVAAAAALRNPKKARALALDAADDIKKAAKSGVDSGEAMWKLALDVARRSIDALGDTNGKGKKAKKGKK
jgi:hypothetical protein